MLWYNMMKRWTVFKRAIFLLAAILLPAGALADGVPGFTLLFPNKEAKADEAFTLDRFRGHPLLIAFWRSDCAPCVTETPILLKIAAAHREVPVALISLQDKAHTLKHFADNPAPNIQVLVAEGKMKDTLNALGDERSALPFSVYLRADGSVCHTRYGLLGTAVADAWVRQC